MDFPKHEDGYGVVLEDARWARDAGERLYEMCYAVDSVLLDDAREWSRDFDLDEWSSTAEMFSDFVDDYENVQIYWGGIEGVLCDYLNERYFDGAEMFQVRDSCLYVAAADLTDNQIGTEYIDDIFAHDVFPLTGDLKTDWLDIRF